MIDNTPSKSAVIKRAAKIVLSLCLVAAVLAGVWFGVQNAGKKLKQPTRPSVPAWRGCSWPARRTHAP